MWDWTALYYPACQSLLLHKEAGWALDTITWAFQNSNQLNINMPGGLGGGGVLSICQKIWSYCYCWQILTRKNMFITPVCQEISKPESLLMGFVSRRSVLWVGWRGGELDMERTMTSRWRKHKRSLNKPVYFRHGSQLLGAQRWISKPSAKDAPATGIFSSRR